MLTRARSSKDNNEVGTRARPYSTETRASYECKRRSVLMCEGYV